LLASVGPIKARQSAIALSFSKIIANTGPLIIVSEKHKKKIYSIKKTRKHAEREVNDQIYYNDQMLGVLTLTSI